MEKPTRDARRYLEVAVFVVGWMAIGTFFHLGSGVYQAIGVAMMIGFQRFVARRPLAQLWVRTAPAFQFDRWTVGLIVVLIGAVGATLLLRSAQFAGPAKGGMMFLFLAAATVPAAFALRHTTVTGLIRALPSIVLGKLAGWAWGLVVIWISGLAGVAARQSPHVALAQWPRLGGEFLFQFLAAFLIEEVIFRGGLDTHVSLGEKTRWGEFRSAAFVAVLWALYHLPIQGAKAATPLQQLGVALFVTGVAIAGIPLAYIWRRSGTLVLSAALHAFGNAYTLAALK